MLVWEIVDICCLLSGAAVRSSRARIVLRSTAASCTRSFSCFSPARLERIQSPSLLDKRKALYSPTESDQTSVDFLSEPTRMTGREMYWMTGRRQTPVETHPIRRRRRVYGVIPKTQWERIMRIVLAPKQTRKKIDTAVRIWLFEIFGDRVRDLFDRSMASQSRFRISKADIARIVTVLVQVAHQYGADELFLFWESIASLNPGIGVIIQRLVLPHITNELASRRMFYQLSEFVARCISKYGEMEVHYKVLSDQDSNEQLEQLEQSGVADQTLITKDGIHPSRESLDDLRLELERSAHKVVLAAFENIELRHQKELRAEAHKSVSFHFNFNGLILFFTYIKLPFKTKFEFQERTHRLLQDYLDHRDYPPFLLEMLRLGQSFNSSIMTQYVRYMTARESPRALNATSVDLFNALEKRRIEDGIDNGLRPMACIYILRACRYEEIDIDPVLSKAETYLNDPKNLLPHYSWYYLMTAYNKRNNLEKVVDIFRHLLDSQHRLERAPKYEDPFAWGFEERPEKNSNIHYRILFNTMKRQALRTTDAPYADNLVTEAAGILSLMRKEGIPLDSGILTDYLHLVALESPLNHSMSQFVSIFGSDVLLDIGILTQQGDELFLNPTYFQPEANESTDVLHVDTQISAGPMKPGLVTIIMILHACISKVRDPVPLEQLESSASNYMDRLLSIKKEERKKFFDGNVSDSELRRLHTRLIFSFHRRKERLLENDEHGVS